MASGGGKKTLDSSAIVEMEVVASDESDYEVDIAGDSTKQIHRDERTDIGDESDGKDDIRKQISKGVANYVWEEGRTRATKAFSLYANIDILRPYYDVEPHEVRSRLVHSLLPRLKTSTDGRIPKVPRELYGPTMLTFTLIALLLYQMKSSGHTVQEGTLMGSAFATCFGYWFGISGLLWVISYVCSTRVAMTQLLNLLGYALFGHCIVVFLTTVFHTVHSHLFFYMLWLVFGGLSSFKLATVLMARTAGRSQKLIVAGFVVAVHLLFLLYLHFAYHRVVEDVSEVFQAGPRLQEVNQLVPQHKVEEAAENVAKSDELKAQFSLDKQQQQANDVKESQQKVGDESSKNEKEVVASNSDVTDSLHRRANKRDRGIARRALPETAAVNNTEVKNKKDSSPETAAVNNTEVKDKKDSSPETAAANNEDANTVKEQT